VQHRRPAADRSAMMGRAVVRRRPAGTEHPATGGHAAYRLSGGSVVRSRSVGICLALDDHLIHVVGQIAEPYPGFVARLTARTGRRRCRPMQYVTVVLRD
jgi:hypothetical protein